MGYIKKIEKGVDDENFEIQSEFKNFNENREEDENEDFHSYSDNEFYK